MVAINEFISLCGLSEKVEQHLISKIREHLGDWVDEDKDLLWNRLSITLQHIILTKNNLPLSCISPWSDTKALRKLIKSEDCKCPYTYVLLANRAQWTVDQLRKLNGKQIIDLQKYCYDSVEDFITFHSIPVLSRLLENVDLGEVYFEEVAEIHNISTEYYFNDLLDKWCWLYENHPTSLKGIRVRDFMSYYKKIERLKLELTPEIKLPINSIIKNRVGTSIGEFEIEFSYSNKTLLRWGEELDHCVGSYTNKVLSGESIILSLNKEGKPIYTVEIVQDPNYRINQFFGVRNSEAPEELKRKLHSRVTKPTIKERIVSTLFYKLW